jgi:hypothetical protein
MLKYIALMALSLAVAVPAMAEETTTDGARPAPNMEQMKAKNAERYQNMQAKKAEHRANVDKMMDGCHEKMQAATTVEQMKAIKQTCRSEGKAYHEANQAKRKEHHEKMQGKREERREKRKAE